MTTDDLIKLLKSTIDEIGGVAPFYVDPDDYLLALNDGQGVVFADLAGGTDAQLDRLPEFVVHETLTDPGGGVALAGPCFMPLSIHTHTAPRHHVTMKMLPDWLAYAGVTKTGFLQGAIAGDKLLTNPANVEVDVYYLRYPVEMFASYDSQGNPVVMVDPEIDEVYHFELWQEAIQILLRKDLTSQRVSMIEAWRNRREMFRNAKAKKSVLEPAKFVPKDIPYQQPR